MYNSVKRYVIQGKSFMRKVKIIYRLITVVSLLIVVINKSTSWKLWVRVDLRFSWSGEIIHRNQKLINNSAYLGRVSVSDGRT